MRTGRLFDQDPTIVLTFAQTRVAREYTEAARTHVLINAGTTVQTVLPVPRYSMTIEDPTVDLPAFIK